MAGQTSQCLPGTEVPFSGIDNTLPKDYNQLPSAIHIPNHTRPPEDD